MVDEPEAASYKATSTAATLFDLRTVIALLFVIYGVMLTLLGLFGDDPAELAKAGGIDINLWTGIGMLVIAGFFGLWLRLSPAVTASAPADPNPDTDSDPVPPSRGGH